MNPILINKRRKNKAPQKQHAYGNLLTDTAVLAEWMTIKNTGWQSIYLADFQRTYFRLLILNRFFLVLLF